MTDNQIIVQSQQNMQLITEKDRVIFDMKDEPVSIQKSSLQVFGKALDGLIGTLSEASQKKYRTTYRLWKEFTNRKGVSLIQFDNETVKEFLTDNEWAHGTRKARLVHLRTFLRALVIAEPDNVAVKQFSEMIGAMKPKHLGGTTRGHKKQAMSAQDVHKMIASMNEDTNKELRDKTIVILLFFYALRIDEVRQLTIDNFDIPMKQIVLSGKKRDEDEFDTVPTLNQDAWGTMMQWISRLNESSTRLIVPRISKSDTIRQDNDKPISIRNVHKIVDRLDVQFDFSSHDGRRSIATHMLNQGASIKDVQRFMRHKSESTTLLYAQGRMGKDLQDSLSKYSY